MSTDFKFFDKNKLSPERRVLEIVVDIPNISEIVLYLLRYCEDNRENLFHNNRSGVILEMEYGRFVFASVDFPENTMAVNNEFVYVGKLDALILFTPNDGGQSYYLNPVQDYDFETEEYGGFFYLESFNSVYFTNETVDNYGYE